MRLYVAVALLVALVNAAPFKSRGQQQPGASSASSSSPFYAAYGGDDDYGFGQSAGYSRFGGYPSYYGHNPYASYGFNRHRPYGYSAPSAYGGGYPYGVGAWTGNFGYPQNPFRFASPQLKQQPNKRPIIAVVAPSGGEKISAGGYKDQPVLLVLNNPAQHQQPIDSEDDDDELFDLSKLLGNFQPAVFDKPSKHDDDDHVIELKPQDSQDGLVGGTANAQFQPSNQQQTIEDAGEDFFQPDSKPIVVPQVVVQEPIEVIAEEKPIEQVVPVAADEPVAQLFELVPLPAAVETVQQADEIVVVPSVDAPAQVEQPATSDQQQQSVVEPVVAPAVQEEEKSSAVLEKVQSEETKVEANEPVVPVEEVKVEDQQQVVAEPVQVEQVKEEPIVESSASTKVENDHHHESQVKVEGGEQVKTAVDAEEKPIEQQQQEVAADQVKVVEDAPKVEEQQVGDAPKVEEHQDAPKIDEQKQVDEKPIEQQQEDAPKVESEPAKVEDVPQSIEQVKVESEPAHQQEDAPKVEAAEVHHQAIEQVKVESEPAQVHHQQEDSAVPNQKVESAQEDAPKVDVEAAKVEDSAVPHQKVESEAAQEDAPKVEAVEAPHQSIEQVKAVDQVDAEAVQTPVEQVKIESSEPAQIEVSENKPVIEEVKSAEEQHQTVVKAVEPAESEKIQPVAEEAVNPPQSDSQVKATAEQPAAGQQQPIVFHEEIIVSSDSIAIGQAPGAVSLPRPVVVAIPERVQPEENEKAVVTDIKPIEAEQVKVEAPVAESLKIESSDVAKKPHDDCKVEYIVVDDAAPKKPEADAAAADAPVAVEAAVVTPVEASAEHTARFESRINHRGSISLRKLKFPLRPRV